MMLSMEVSRCEVIYKERRKGIPEGCFALKVGVTENDLLVGVVGITRMINCREAEGGDRHERRNELESFGLKHGPFNQMN